MDKETMGLSEAVKYAIYGLSELPNRPFNLDGERHNTSSLIEVLRFVFNKYTTLTLQVREPVEDEVLATRRYTANATNPTPYANPWYNIPEYQGVQVQAPNPRGQANYGQQLAQAAETQAREPNQANGYAALVREQLLNAREIQIRDTYAAIERTAQTEDRTVITPGFTTRFPF